MDGISISGPPERRRSGDGDRQALIPRLQADVDARKRHRPDLWPSLRIGALVLVLGLTTYELGARSVDSGAGWTDRAVTKSRLMAYNSQVDALSGQLEIQRVQLERLERAFALSTRYGIGAELALTIEEVALAENVDPDLAFELVRLESNFNPRAVSPVGALGLAQLMPATARMLAPDITRQDLLEPETNLRLGFRFFRSLLDYYDGDVRLALLAYNRGPYTVDRLLEAGVDPANGYASTIMRRRAVLP
jgi:soluble lytic murein transglycosylase-like protein